MMPTPKNRKVASGKPKGMSADHRGKPPSALPTDLPTNRRQPKIGSGWVPPAKIRQVR